jgi:hypothetical protein
MAFDKLDLQLESVSNPISGLDCQFATIAYVPCDHSVTLVDFRLAAAALKARETLT